MADSGPKVKSEHVVALCFRRGGQLYWFNSGGLEVQPGQFVVADTEKGLDLGQVVMVQDQPEPGSPLPTQALVRKATPDDFAQARRREDRENRALVICQEKMTQHGAPMKLVLAKYTLDGQHLSFFFTADGRVDFRSLVRDLAETFHCRIELRQIGVRDQAKLLGGVGSCGQPLCCGRFLREFESVGIRLAKDQDLPLNPDKISGVCGRLMCCLRFEHAGYIAARQELPEVGAQVMTPGGSGAVVDRNILKQELTVKLDDDRTVRLGVTELQAMTEERAKSTKNH